ncbi:MAG: glycosyltransferase family 4 protein [Candidatus Andersenbacteria bacterium]|nr:glycosyltransferase family 4 protein [Candidatus Andersenbacteria bacterium]
MNILIVNFEYPPLGGGGGVATKQIAQELSARHTVTVLTTGFMGLPKREMDGQVEVVRVLVLGRTGKPTATLLSMLTFVLTAFWAGLWLCREKKFTVINAQFVIPSGMPAAALSWLFTIPLVVSFIGGDIYDPSKGISPHRYPVLRLLIRWITRQATACTAISEDTRHRAQDLHGIRKEIMITHLGLEPARVSPKTRPELGLGAGITCITVGRLIPRKAYEVLLLAWQQVKEANLLIIGDGPLKDKLQDLIVQYGLQERVKLLGFVSDEAKQQLLRVSDIYVSAAEHEGFGIVFLEAMDAGLPIVAANEGGHTDFLFEGKQALLVGVNDADALAAAVNRLAANEGLRRSMAAICRETVTHFYLRETTKRFETVLVWAAQRV